MPRAYGKVLRATAAASLPLPPAGCAADRLLPWTHLAWRDVNSLGEM